MTAVFNLMNIAIEQIGESQKFGNTAARQIGKAESTIYDPGASAPSAALESAERHILSSIRMLTNAHEAIRQAMECRPAATPAQTEASSPDGFTPRVCVDNTQHSGGRAPLPPEPPRAA